MIAAAACGGSSNNHTGADAGSGGGQDAGSNTGSDPLTAVGSGLFTIPLTTPTGDDAGAIYNVAFTASGTTFSVTIDTGSTTAAIAGSNCSGCSGVSPLYALGAGARQTGGSDSESYEDGTGWGGSIVDDGVTFGGGLPAEPLKFVDITSSQDFFDGNEYQGIVGMATDGLLDPGETAYYTTLVQAGMTPVQAYELCPTGGTLWFGGFDATHTTGALQTAALLGGSADNSVYYAVDMTAMALGSADLGATESSLDGPVVDTGTSLMYIPTPAETAFLADLNASASFKALFPKQTIDETDNGQCVNAATGTTDTMVDDMLPPLKLTITGTSGPFTLSLPALSYLYNGGGGQYCLGMFDGGDDGDATLGDVFMTAFVTVIDTGHETIGFAPTATCKAPEVVQAVQPHRIRELGRGPHRHHPRVPGSAR